MRKAPSPPQRPPRAARWWDRFALLLAGSTVADVLLALPNPVGGRLRSAASQLLFTVAEWQEQLPLLDDASDRGAVVGGLLLAALFVGPGLMASRWFSRAGAVLLHLGVLPALLGLLAGLGGAAALAPLPAVLLLAFAVLGSPEKPSSTPRWGVALAALVGCWGLTFAHAVYVSGPGMQPTLLGDAGPVAALAGVLGALPRSPLLRPAVQCASLLFAVAALAALHRRGASLSPRPSRGPAAVAASLLGLLVLVGLVAAPTYLLDTLRCPAPHPALRWVDHSPGTFQLAVQADGVWLVDRQGQALRHLSRDGAPLPAPPARRAGWPEELVTTPDGLFVAWVPEHGAGSLLLPVTADPRERGVPVPGCFVASSLVRSTQGDVLLGCEYDGALATFAEGRARPAGELPGVGSVESLARGRDAIYAAPLWHGDRLVQLDPDSLAVRGHRFAGDFGWGLAARDGLLALGRFQEGRVDLFDEDLGRRGSARIGFGVRDVELWDDGDGLWALALASGAGRIGAVPATGGPTRSLPVGGGVRDLALDGDDLWFGGRCGVGVVDLPRWLR